MKIARLGIWVIIVILFTLLASIPVVWATPEQNTLNQSLPPATAIVATPTVGTPTATPIPLLPPSGSNVQGNGFFLLTGIFLIGSALVILLNVLRKGDRKTG
jgi:hypothetical protein